MPSRSRALALVLVVALAAIAGTIARAGPPGEDDGPPPPPPPYVVENVSVPTADGMALAATYGAAGGRPGAAVVLVHMEDSTRAAWEPMFARLEEHRVPWLAIDLRGYGGSATQHGKDLSAAARAGDPALRAAMADDVYGAVRFLVEKKGHDPKRIGLVAAGLGASAAARCARLHKGEIAALVLLNPRQDYAGFETKADFHDFDGKMEVRIISSVDDTKLPNGEVDTKGGPLKLLYNLEIDRNAPRDTPYELREARRRGVAPRWLGLPYSNVFGTKMLTGVPQMDCWLAALLARTFSTYPNPVLFDGWVKREDDYADPAWLAGVTVPAPGGLEAHALRWGRRMMIGAVLPKDVRTIRLHVDIGKSDGPETGQEADISFPSGETTATKVQRRGGRGTSIEVTNLTGPPLEIPVGHGQVEYSLPSFEAEYRLPNLSGSAPLEVRIALEVVTESGTVITGAGVDHEKVETWALVPDGDAGAAPPAPPVPSGPTKPAPPSPPDPPMGFPGR